MVQLKTDHYIVLPFSYTKAADNYKLRVLMHTGMK